MRRYWVFAGTVFACVLSLWLLVDAFGVPLLADPAAAMDGRGPWPALVGVGLLVVDAVLPVPSVLIMVANGALFGVVTGALLSLVGKLGAAVVGFALGRGGRGMVDRLLGGQERQRGERLLARWGLLAILVSRPVPVLAETVVLLAGTSGLRLTPVALIVLVGSVPEALAYGLAGAAAVSLGNQVLIWLALLVLAGMTWLVMRRIERRTTQLVSQPGGAEQPTHHLGGRVACQGLDEDHVSEDREPG